MDFYQEEIDKTLHTGPEGSKLKLQYFKKIYKCKHKFLTKTKLNLWNVFNVFYFYFAKCLISF